MPYNRRRGTHRRGGRPRRRILATRPRMMTRAQNFKRMNQVSTDLKYFKINGTSTTNLAGHIERIWRTQDIVDNPPNGFQYMKQLYDQYKCLAIRVKVFPANVGIEPDSALFASNALLRGNTIFWSDQREEPVGIFPSAITEVISDGSARLINSRRAYTRSLYRPKGHPEWGSTQDQTNEPDTWTGAVYQLTTDATPATVTVPVGPVLYFWTLQYKVLFRGRRTPP